MLRNVSYLFVILFLLCPGCDSVSQPPNTNNHHNTGNQDHGVSVVSGDISGTNSEDNTITSTRPTIHYASVDGTLVEGEDHLVSASCRVTDSDGTVQSVTVDLSPIGGSRSQALSRNSASPEVWGWSGFLIPPSYDGWRSFTMTFVASDEEGNTDHYDVPVRVGAPSQGAGRNSTTGVTGLNTPSEIINHPDVAETIRQLEQATASLGTPIEPLLFTSSGALDPPHIEGRYNLEGLQLVPFEAKLLPGTWRWSNQTSDNHIDTYYQELLGGSVFQEGVSNVGEIIRGNGSGFTVYSIIEATQGDCSATGVIIVGGTVQDDGSILGTYASTVVESSPQCSGINSAGLLILERE